PARFVLEGRGTARGNTTTSSSTWIPGVPPSSRSPPSARAPPIPWGPSSCFGLPHREDEADAKQFLFDPPFVAGWAGWPDCPMARGGLREARRCQQREGECSEASPGGILLRRLR